MDAFQLIRKLVKSLSYNLFFGNPAKRGLFLRKKHISSLILCTTVKLQISRQFSAKRVKILSDTIFQYFIGFVQWFHLPTIFLIKLKGDNFFRCSHELFQMEQDQLSKLNWQHMSLVPVSYGEFGDMYECRNKS